MDKIKIKIDGRVAETESAPEVVTDNAEYEVEFAVDERDGWNPAAPMTALFVRRDAKYTAVVMDVGETSCTMPPQTGTNVVYIGLTQEEMRTTTPARIQIRRSVRTMTDFPPLPDKDVYEQILANFAGLRMLSGEGAPTTETAGKVNQLYRDETNNRIYVCVDDASGYTWAMISGSGGGGADVTIDTTLTKSGQAADAKAAGDAIRGKLDATELPTAINDALAQAKASGAFDGAKGDKGDTGPKGPKGDTGPTGPKGADGKDGAGMDVTGAKVGQIAKITAVDSAGKPTGWEPVDMAEGEKWELINTLIVADGTEETNALIFNTDSNGNAFQLRKARLCCAFPPYTGSSTIPNYSFSVLNGLVTGSQTPLGYTNVFPRLSATAATGSVWTIDVSGPLMAESVVRGTNWGDPTKLSKKYYTYGTAQSLPNEYFASATFAYPITSIGGTAVLIYPGCRFELYGVRA